MKSLLDVVALISFGMDVLRKECALGTGAFKQYVVRLLVLPACAMWVRAVLATKKLLVDRRMLLVGHAVNTRAFRSFVPSALMRGLVALGSVSRA